MGLFSFLSHNKSPKPAESITTSAVDKAPPTGSKLANTGVNFADKIVGFLRRARRIDDQVLGDIEDQLLMADVGIEASRQIIDTLKARLATQHDGHDGAVIDALRATLVDLLRPSEAPLVVDTNHLPFVILVVGINGAGKTTTIGKLASQLQSRGLSVMLAAGDTFRAAAIEQLQTWGERNQVPVVAQQQGADSASVIYDALASAKARGTDVLIVDTAGRLHTQSNLMTELEKVRRVIGKLDPEAPHETLLVLDGGTGQNAMQQAQSFSDVMAVSGLVVTKLDGTTKGGRIVCPRQ